MDRLTRSIGLFYLTRIIENDNVFLIMQITLFVGGGRYEAIYSRLSLGFLAIICGRCGRAKRLSGGMERLLLAERGAERYHSIHRYVQGKYRARVYLRLRSQGRRFPGLSRCQWQLYSIGAFRRCLFDWYLPGRSAANDVS
jgi:hypothetical protein